ncbi:hypothetical protein KTO58_06770 [Chitinophaga pendula]|uniref:M57 family metalloprotease n=1 Tax=Chitinophaga TaxID=79328 RepID=UPI000BAEDE49|nr:MULTISPECIES: M57 family metalloprotease [Chitinophaga]ASZ13487.1 hypothetical protein CK934_22280 [Chitinophaga sp. MD30]UCJ08883.1 hypothetical protein KTO58_06770 [Chitinophaga pendula]
MKKYILFLLILFPVLFYSCQKSDKKDSPAERMPDQIVSKLKAAGFNLSEGLMRFKDGYLVEHDIYLTNEQILALPAAKDSKSPQTEHYSTDNLVAISAGTRTIRVFMDGGFGPYMQQAFDAALARYNEQHLNLVFERAATAAQANISILAFYQVGPILGYSAGFPSGGNPASPISLNTFYYNDGASRADATTTIAHEIGHAIGFRHTDYMNRAYSCGGGGNEGGAGVGANPIWPSPTDPTPDSWMLACSNNTDRPFTLEDRIALVALYPGAYPGDVAPVGKIISLRSASLNKFVCAEHGGDEPLLANRDVVELWEQFRVIDLGSGLIALQAVVNNRYVCAENAGLYPLIANRQAISTWEQFRWINNSDGTISLQAVVSNSYVCAEHDGGAYLNANRPAIGDWEKFYWQEVQ